MPTGWSLILILVRFNIIKSFLFVVVNLFLGKVLRQRLSLMLLLLLLLFLRH